MHARGLLHNEHPPCLCCVAMFVRMWLVCCRSTSLHILPVSGGCTLSSSHARRLRSALGAAWGAMVLGSCLDQRAVKLCSLCTRFGAVSCRKYCKYCKPGSGVALRHNGACLVLPCALCFVAGCGVVPALQQHHRYPVMASSQVFCGVTSVAFGAWFILDHNPP